MKTRRMELVESKGLKNEGVDHSREVILKDKDV